MNDIAATRTRAIFLNAAGEKIGTFDGFISVEEIRVDGHGEGSYEPPAEGDVFIVVRRPELNINARVDRAYVRNGVIGFRAWLSQR